MALMLRGGGEFANAPAESPQSGPGPAAGQAGMTGGPEPNKPALRKARFWLAAVLAASFLSRAVWLAGPAEPIFDELYYITSARNMYGLEIDPSARTAGLPAGFDAHPEHPPLGKIFIAGGIALFGDRPLGWRAASVLAGTVALGLMYLLVRKAGGSGLLAAGAASLMAADNLFVVHGSMATLDIFALAFMLGAAVLYLAGRPLQGGLVLGAGACTKLAAGYLLAAAVVLEVLRAVAKRRGPAEDEPGSGSPLKRLAIFTSASAATYLALLFFLDLYVTGFRNPISHTLSMIDYSAELGKMPLVAFAAPISAPWEWLINRLALPYYWIEAPGSDRLLLFQGRINPFVIHMAIPALGVAIWKAVRGERPARLAASWSLGVFGALAGSLAFQGRPGYLYYMLVVLPGVYLADAQLFSGRYMPRWATVAYGVAVAAHFVVFYPLSA